MKGRRTRALAAVAASAASVPLFFFPAPAAAAPADAIRYPYIAALSRQSGENRVYFCAGTLVAPQWILTAAHCFHSRSGERIAVADLWAVVGRDRLRRAEPEAQIRVDRIVLFPDYDPRTQEDDLALVRLEQIAGPLVAEAAGPASDPPDATALGFGSFYEGMLAGRALNSSGFSASQVSDELRRARIRFVHPAECPGGAPAETGMRLCVTAAPDEACVGDSGGPLIAEAAEGPDRLLGVLSFGTGCAVAEPLVAYTRIAPYARWIAATIAAD